MVTVALIVRIEVKPGREAEFEAILRQALPIVEAEPNTTTWFALKFGPSSFGIFDAFADESGRREHLMGKLAAELAKHAEALMTGPPTTEQTDVIAAKLPK